MRTPHTSVRKGKRVLLRLRNGDYIVDKFVEKKGNTVVLEGGRYKVKQMLSMTIYKPLT